MTAILAVSGLVKRYGEHTVLDGVDIEVGGADRRVRLR